MRPAVSNETQSLFKLGTVRDVNRIGGAFLAAAALGSQATEAFLEDETVYLTMPDGEIEAFHEEQEEDGGARGEEATRAGDE